MKNIAIKLSELIDDYPVFEENQVLTEEQLNTVVRYLDQQNRLTRRTLHGYGTVCGLKITSRSGNIGLSKGCGLTTDGDLLTVEEDKNYRFYREFSDENAEYPLFSDTKVFELVPEDVEKPNDAKSLRNLGQNELAGFAAVLYLESYLFDPDICSGGDCDNKGMTQVNETRLLLVKKEVLDKMAPSGSLSKKYFDLHRVTVGRVRLSAITPNKYSNIATEFLNQAKEAGGKLKKELTNAWDLLGPLLGHQDEPVKGWMRSLDAILGQSNEGAQYIHDLLKDLCQAYNEFVESVFHCQTICLPDIAHAPKHLALGDALGRVDDAKDPHRQQWVSSPALNHHGDSRVKIRFLFNRIGELIQAFDMDAAQQIRITPEKKDNALGKRAIPAYYRVDRQNRLNEKWDLETLEREKTDEICSYHATVYSQKAETRDPLAFELHGTDHFRIEGHLGDPFETVLKKLHDEIRKYNLPVKVIPIMIENDPPKAWVFPKYRFYGMEILHKLYRDEMIHNLNELKKFNVELNDRVQKADDEQLPPMEIEGNTLSMKAFTGQQIQMVNQKVDAAKTLLGRSLVEFDTDGFEQNYKSVMEQAAVLNKGVKGVTFSSAFTPLEKVVNNVNFSKLKWIGDLIRKREDKAKEKSVLEKFLEDHPGLEHTGGVPEGGTFILLYSSSDKKVVADFSLPYMHYDEQVEEVPEGSDTSDNNMVFDWKWNNDVFVYIDPAKKLESKMDLLNNKYQQLEFDLGVQKTNLSTFQGSIGTLIQTLPGYTFGGGFEVLPGYTGIDDPELARNAGLMKEFERYGNYIENKKNAGTATNTELAMYDDMEKVMGALIENTLEKTSSMEGDIQPGSGEAMIMEMAVNNSKKIKNREVKNSLKNKVTEIKNTTSERTNYLKNLNMFKF